MSDSEGGPGAGLSGSAGLPRCKPKLQAQLQKMIKESLPAGQRVAADLVELVVECCTEFVEMVSSSANEISTQENKTVINPEHVVAALEQLGFVELKQAVSEHLQELKADTKAAKQKPGRRRTGAEQAGMSEEEQIALQQRMFAEAKAASQLL